MAKDFFKQFIDKLADENTAVATAGTASSDIGTKTFISTGSLIFNAALSGSLFGGLPQNRCVLLAGETSVGKSFFAMALVKEFLASDPSARVIYYDTESAVTNEMLEARGIPSLDRIAKSEPETLEEFRNSALKMLDMYQEIPVEDRFPLLIVLDSMTALPSAKEVGDVREGKDTRDMTKQQILKGIFRLLRLRLAKTSVPMVITSHTYNSIGAYVPTKVVAGGSGAQYASDIIVMLSKKADKIDNEHVGNIVHVKMQKSRFSREGTKVDTRILFEGGLDKYYGLLPFAVDSGLVKKVANKYEFPNGAKAFEKSILANPEKYFTHDLLTTLDTYIESKFSYLQAGTGETTDVSETEE